MSLQIVEGFSPLSLPKIAPDCQTYYKKVVVDGECSKDREAVPIVILHGGPLLGHDYCTPLQELAHHPNISAVIFYDQLGCGKSTHIPAGNQTFSDEFWSISLYQLKSLLDDLRLTTTGFYLLGHCLGSIFALAYAASHPQGLRALIVANALVSLADLRTANLQLLKEFPPDVANGIIHFEEFCLGDRAETLVSLKEYVWASDEFRRKYFNRAPLPTTKYWDKSRANVMEVMDVFATVAGGRVRFLWGGTASKYSAEPSLHRIGVETLVVKGEFDHCLPFCQDPIVRLVPRVRQITLKNASHMTTEEVPEELVRAVGEFVNDVCPARVMIEDEQEQEGTKEKMGLEMSPAEQSSLRRLMQKIKTFSCFR